MMIPSTMPARTIPVGLGQAVSPETFQSIVAMKAPSDFPSWCSWMPFADYMPACKVPTAAQQNAAIKTEIEKAAGAGTPAYNPDLAAQQYEEYLKDSAAYCAAHPDECAEYTAASANPTCAALLGTGPLAQSFCGHSGLFLLAGIGAVGLILWKEGRA